MKKNLLKFLGLSITLSTHAFINPLYAASFQEYEEPLKEGNPKQLSLKVNTVADLPWSQQANSPVPPRSPKSPKHRSVSPRLVSQTFTIATPEAAVDTTYFSDTNVPYPTSTEGASSLERDYTTVQGMSMFDTSARSSLDPTTEQYGSLLLNSDRSTSANNEAQISILGSLVHTSPTGSDEGLNKTDSILTDKLNAMETLTQAEAAKNNIDKENHSPYVAPDIMDQLRSPSEKKEHRNYQSQSAGDHPIHGGYPDLKRASSLEDGRFRNYDSKSLEKHPKHGGYPQELTKKLFITLPGKKNPFFLELSESELKLMTSTTAMLNLFVRHGILVSPINVKGYTQTDLEGIFQQIKQDQKLIKFMLQPEISDESSSSAPKTPEGYLKYRRTSYISQ